MEYYHYFAVVVRTHFLSNAMGCECECQEAAGTFLREICRRELMFSRSVSQTVLLRANAMFSYFQQSDPWLWLPFLQPISGRCSSETSGD